MAGRGDKESDKLKQNLEEQLDRLVAQLQDLEDCREDLDDDEYEETKNDTVEQLKEFQESLVKMAAGNMSLVDEIGAMNLAIQAAIGGGVKNTEVIRMIGKRDPDALRSRLGDIEKSLSSGSITESEHAEQKAEILSAIRKLGGKCSEAEVAFIAAHGSDALNQFEAVDSNLAGMAALNIAGAGVGAAKQ
jgi:hypothetical protein